MHWDATTMVLVQATAENGQVGLGYTYAHAAAAAVIRQTLAAVVQGLSIFQVGKAWERMVNAVRNLGRPGVASHAISAVDTALWDLKARVLELPLFHLLNAHRNSVPLYGSGGFTTYDDQRTRQQLSGWVSQGIPRIKIKIGEEWGTKEAEDVRRVALAREVIGPDVELMIDANGGYTPKQAIRLGRRYAEEFGVTYFEEPVSSDHLQQLKLVRDNTPLAVAAGEYGYSPWYFRDMLRAGAVDVLQADVTRCLGVTGWLMAADLAYGFDIPLSAHTAPALHLHLGCAAPQLDHIEYFHDHVRIEKMFFEGFPAVKNGRLHPDPLRLGLGLTLKTQDSAPYRIDA
ncbi:MAG: mandelate racemase [Anaerolineaceae bacterium]|nr:mandelate racemase [Anaerolineaceae bacterium]